MPVWHAKTQALRKAGKLKVVAITQEQHPARTRLFAQWKGLDFPILWDPFNLTDSRVVPRFRGVDAHGVLRVARLRPGGLEAFLSAVDPTTATTPMPPLAPRLLGPPTPVRAALGDLLWRPAQRDAAIGVLERALAKTPNDAALRFRLGVAYRMRFDSAGAKPQDFSKAVAAWRGALQRDPGQYIWRRRIQQFGPRLDKPYPFYGWVAQAQRELRARGQTPVALAAPLTGSERVGRGERFTPAATATPPDPSGKLPRDTTGLVALEVTVTPGTGKRRAWRVHLTLRPDRAKTAHWNNESDPLRVWIGAPLPDGVTVDQRLLTLTAPKAASSDEVRRLDVEVRRSSASTAKVLKGYVVYGVCDDVDGTCRLLRQDFRVPLE